MGVQRSQVLLLAGFRGIWVPHVPWSLLGALGALRDVPRSVWLYPPGREGNGGGSHLEFRCQDEVELGLGVVESRRFRRPMQGGETIIGGKRHLGLRQRDFQEKTTYPEELLRAPRTAAAATGHVDLIQTGREPHTSAPPGPQQRPVRVV